MWHTDPIVWRARLPEAVRTLKRRWALTLGRPFTGEDHGASWVAPATLRDGTSAVLKIGMPHMESANEIDGLRFWNGDLTCA